MANMLAIDTSTDRAVLALSTHFGKVQVASGESARRHGRDLLPLLQSLLADAGLRAGNLAAIAVGLGPGSYTGLRVGVTAAKVLAYATGARVIGLNSLQVIAANVPGSSGRVSVVADAQRGDLYVADLARATIGGRLEPLGATRIESIAVWAERLEAGTTVLGPALASGRVRASIPAGAILLTDADNYPRGENLIAAAREAPLESSRDDSWLLEPLYLRRSAAEDQWDARIVPPA